MPGTPASKEAELHRLGILLVHGIGTQPQRETLVRWGDALVELIAGATKAPEREAAAGGAAEAKAGEEDAPKAATEEVPNATPAARPPLTVTLDRARPGSGTAEDAAEVALALETADGRQERWLLTECWWADVFPPPTYGELVSWSVRAVPWSIALHVAQRYWQCSEDGGMRRAWAAVRATGQLLVALALSPLVVVLLSVALLLGLLPIPQLRSFILAAQSTLTATVGDSLAFVESPVRAALIHSRLRDGLAGLRARCERMIVVAHSQGAAVVHEALGGRNPSDGGGEVRLAAATPVPETLVTFGAGIGKLVALREAPSVVREIGRNPVAAALRWLLFTAGMAGFVFLSVRTGALGLRELLWSALLALVVLIALVALWFALDGPLARLRASTRIKIAVSLVVAVLAIVWLVAKRSDLDPWPLLGSWFAVLGLYASIWTIFEPRVKKILTSRVCRPPGVRRWVDLYASHDPVSNGALGVRDVQTVESVPVWNEGSLLGDHTSYWANRDEFVLRVVRECAATASSSWAHLLPPPPTPAAGEPTSSERRVGYLRRARMLGRLGWFAVFVLIWSRWSHLVPQPFELPAWIPAWAPAAFRFLLLAGAVALAAAATSALLRRLWLRWVRSEQDAYLASRPLRGWTWGHPLTAMVILLGLLAVALQALVEALIGGGLFWTALGGAPSAPRQLSGSTLLLLGFLALMLLPSYAMLFGALLKTWEHVARRPRARAAPAGTAPTP